MARRTFGWRTALNGRAAKIEARAQDGQPAGEAPVRSGTTGGGDLWWSVGLAQLFLVGVVVLLVVRSLRG